MLEQAVLVLMQLMVHQIERAVTFVAAFAVLAPFDIAFVVRFRQVVGFQLGDYPLLHGHTRTQCLLP